MGKLQGEPSQNVHYVHEMLEQLLEIVPPGSGRFLYYLIDMARLEASDLIVRYDAESSDTRAPG